VVEHAGILVAGETRLNAQVIELIKPLVYFDPDEWDAVSRKALARDLILFASESVVVPRMRTSRHALRALIADLHDRDVADPAADILRFSDRLFTQTDQQQKSLARYSEPYTGANSELQTFENVDGPSLILASVAEHEYGPDSSLSSALPMLLAYLRGATTKGRALRLRAFAGELAGYEGRDRRLSMGQFCATAPLCGYPRTPEQSVLAPYAADMQAAFGRLIAAQQRAFPNLPPPTWAF
jgi:hypothetical protein